MRRAYPPKACGLANTPEQFAAQTRAEYEVYKKGVEEQKLELE